jgi:hypothetical protein
MRIKDGKVYLDKKRDTRVGNFVYTIEPEHIKVQDISAVATHRISRRVPKGQLLMMFLKDPKEHERSLHNYAAIMFNTLCTVPDAQFYQEMYDASIACVNRHKDIYGLKDDISAAEDAKIVQEERDLQAAADEIVEKAGGEEEAEGGDSAEGV